MLGIKCWGVLVTHVQLVVPQLFSLPFLGVSAADTQVWGITKCIFFVREFDVGWRVGGAPFFWGGGGSFLYIHKGDSLYLPSLGIPLWTLPTEMGGHFSETCP